MLLYPNKYGTCQRKSVLDKPVSSCMIISSVLNPELSSHHVPCLFGYRMGFSTF